MKKRPYRKRPKRSGASGGSQRRQNLSKTVRELYRPGAEEDPDATEWHAELEGELEQAPRGRARARTAARIREEASQEAEPDAETSGAPGRSGRITAISSGSCRVLCEDESVDCVLPSDLARDQRSTVAVGDDVIFAPHGKASFRLRSVLPRRTVLSRPDPQNPRHERVIAANIDIAIHVESVARPPLRPALIDRYLIAIARGGADAAICVNKIDLLAEEERRIELAKLAPYCELGLPILPCSTKTGEGVDEIRTLLAGRTAVFVGHSGVGKSSMLNALSPGLGADTGTVSRRYGKGRHTTSQSNLYRLADGIRVIDTPGIREFGLWKLSPRELSAYFEDFEEHAARCRFGNCAHTHEPGCGVRAAVAAGELLPARYNAYRRIRASLDSDS